MLQNSKNEKDLIRFPERRQPSRATVFRLKSNLLNYGCYSKPRQPHVERNEAGEINVLACVEARPQISCRKIEEEVGVSKTKVQKILKKHKFKPYKVNIIQELHPDDPFKRLEFSNWFLTKTNRDPDFAKKVIWSDESYISSSGIFNRQNTRHWYQENQHITFERQQQGRFGFSVSCFVLGTKIVYTIFEGSLTAQRYLNILQNNMPELLEDIPLAQRHQIYFQQDGAPAHNSRVVTEYLSAHFSRRWIGTHGPIRWPPRSPDLSILDFFVWSYLKNKIYANRHNNIDELRASTEEAFRNLQRQPFIILNAFRRIETVCGLCIRQNGRQFEQFY